MKQIETKILKNENLTGDFYRMRVESGYLAKNSKPGQFAEILCSAELEPLLRRPLGIHRVAGFTVEFLYEVVGKGTALLAAKKPGQSVNIIGPLGRGFEIGRAKKYILVAGGNGIAPIFFLAETLIKQKKDVCLLLGGCSKSHILCESDLKKAGIKALIATEDGTCGEKGLVTDLLDLVLTVDDNISKEVYACGPTGMLKAVAGIAKGADVSCQVSLEEHMACGVGVCLGCPVKIKSAESSCVEYKMVCKDGPVFRAEEVVWE